MKMVEGKETEVEKEWSYFELSPYSFLSFLEFQQLVGTLGAGLKKMGLETGHKVHLYGATRFVGIMVCLRGGILLLTLLLTVRTGSPWHMVLLLNPSQLLLHMTLWVSMAFSGR